MLRLFPSITLQTVHAFLQPPIEGMILQTYGSGNMPSNRQDILDELEAAIQRGVIIVNCSQCIRGSVKDAYQTGKVLYDIGVTAGADMTPEAALTKLSYVLSKDEWDLATKRKMLGINLRGELTVTAPTPSLMQGNKKMAIPIGQGIELDLFSRTQVVFPALLSSAAVNDDPTRIDNLLSCGADLSQPNVDHRTALHVACCEGKLEIVEYMLHRGASVHTKDRYDHTPLTDAVLHDRHEIIKLLVSCGAHMTIPPKVLGEKLCKAATRGDVTRLKSYKLAGAKLSEADYSGRTALHLAALHGHRDCIAYLLKQKQVNRDAEDMLGYTPLDYAEKANNNEIISLMNDCYIK
ncbi:hypothetical protein J437_LFUL002778 [Ladona fulva]|uniref:asparaginase n=1 Tax=Ladona fulva TaxID=123851 RepID=A0A8K0JSQ8_LADFU|nr:hypothetical protein J437_LFUL002778 [Ladona fulva]